MENTIDDWFDMEYKEMMENKQTAVDYLFEKLFDSFERYHASGNLSQFFIDNMKERNIAKKMEKEQLEKFYLLGDKDGFQSCYYHNSNCLDFEQHYNETYDKD